MHDEVLNWKRRGTFARQAAAMCCAMSRPSTDQNQSSASLAYLLSLAMSKPLAHRMILDPTGRSGNVEQCRLSYNGDNSMQPLGAHKSLWILVVPCPRRTDSLRLLA